LQLTKTILDFILLLLGSKLSKKELSKGAVQFLLDRPIPFDLIKRIVVFRVQENLKK
jgi:uncharacterized protein YdhG (YjbR/CyaY superfamily)